MMIFFDPRTADRLAAIEADEGIPKEELVRQAVMVWCELEAGERRETGIYAMQLVTRRLRGDRK